MTKPPKDDPLLTANEVAAMLRTPTGTLRWWRHTGEGGPASFKIGRRTVYLTSVVEAFIAEQQERTGSEKSA